MELRELLQIRPGVTALTGGGGKTATMYTLARELSRRGTVVCTTTTHIWPPEHLPVINGSPARLREALARYGCVCAGAPGDAGKLTAPELPAAALAEAADYVLVEADGSKGLPVKAHLPHEPVIPAETGLVITLVGAPAFGRPVREAAHRWERFCRLTGASPEEPVTPENLAKLLVAERIGDKIFLNQAETPEAFVQAERLAGLVSQPVFAGAVKAGIWRVLP